MPIISLIVATAKNGVIGIKNTLPWHLPEDLKRFKALTMGHHIIMGRKTFESLGRLLPGRTTIVITRNKDYKIKDAIVVHSLEEAIQKASADTEIFLIGGAELYQVGLNFADKLYITEVQAEFEGDAYFPPIDLKDWQETMREANVNIQGLKFSYVTYERKIKD